MYDMHTLGLDTKQASYSEHNQSDLKMWN